ncbi:MAG TPA: response regulator [Gemmatimonadaceae bacterium]|nr:response regulator [Gemmatimonadaceae bacterium]
MSSSTVTEPRHVLVVDDEPHIGRIIKTKLEHGPFRVTLVYDGQQALDALAAHDDVALVVLDLMMPYVDGLEVLQRMRARSDWQRIPTVVLTAAGEERYQRKALSLGAREFLTKPFSPKKLFQRVMELAGAPVGGTSARQP